MIISVPSNQSAYVTVPPFSVVPVTIQIEDPTGSGNWVNYGSIKYTGHVVRLYGEATYRFVVGAPGPDCCVVYTEVDVIDATPEANTKSVPVTTTAVPLSRGKK